MSESDANALKYCREELEGFKQSKATETFCSIFNDMFNLLNSRNKFRKVKTRRPISEKNFDSISANVDKYVKYIESLKIAFLYCRRDEKLDF